MPCFVLPLLIRTPTSVELLSRVLLRGAHALQTLHPLLDILADRRPRGGGSIKYKDVLEVVEVLWWK